MVPPVAIRPATAHAGPAAARALDQAGGNPARCRSPRRRAGGSATSPPPDHRVQARAVAAAGQDAVRIVGARRSPCSSRQCRHGAMRQTPLDRTRKPTHLLYLHGFRSSPQSAQGATPGRLGGCTARLHWWCPAAALAAQNDGAAWRGEASPAGRQHDGRSSAARSGGFYATVLAERLGCPAGAAEPGGRPGARPDPTSASRGLPRPGRGASSSARVRQGCARFRPPVVTQPQRYFAVDRQGRRAAGLARDERPLCRRPHQTARRQRPCTLVDFDEHLGEIVAFLSSARVRGEFQVTMVQITRPQIPRLNQNSAIRR